MNLEQKIESIIEPVLLDMDIEIVKIAFLNDEKNTLQILIENTNRKAIDIDRIARASRAISASIDVEDPITKEYVLEVSSPGIDRPLTKLNHFERFAGYEAKVELANLIDNRKRFRGILKGISEENLLIEVDGEDFELPFDEVSKAKLVLTDKLIKDSKEGI